MVNHFSIADDILLKPNGITINQLTNILAKALKRNDFADLYLQYSHHEAWMLEESIVKNGSFDIGYGAGIRSITRAETGFAYTNELKYETLLEAANKASAITKSGKAKLIKVGKSVVGHDLYPNIDPLTSIPDQAKINLLQTLDRTIRALDPKITNVTINLAGAYSVILVINSDGELTSDVRPVVQLSVTVIAIEQNKLEIGTAGAGWRRGYDDFLANNFSIALDCGKEAARIALLNLDAKSAPAGVMPVVLGAGWPAVLLHEAVGHGLEGDFIRKKSSVFTDKLGEYVASPECTIVDNGQLAGQLRGSLNIDDEGTPTQCTTLIEKGKLVGFMQDRLNAKLTGTKSTGNGRRESYAHPPIPRMTNTYMLAGKYAPEEIIASVDKGVYAVNFSGGQVDITSGKFVFSTNEAYMIEHGKITYPIKGVTLIGDGPTVLTKVAMLGNDLKLDPGIGYCGKDGQSVAVGVGQPTLKISEITVGGSQVS